LSETECDTVLFAHVFI